MCSENEKPDRLIRMLYDIADDAEAPANSRLSAIKEILDRTVGKGVMLGGEQTEVQPVEIVFRIVDDTNSPSADCAGGAVSARRRGRRRQKPRSAARCFAVCGLLSGFAAAHAATDHAGAGALARTGGFAAVSAVHCQIQGE